MLRVNAENLERLDAIAALLRDGGLVCFPTDTTYGLAVDANNHKAIERLFDVKGRPENQPILLLINSMAMLDQVAVVPRNFHAIAERFWPGPITFVLPATHAVPDRITAGTATIGVRWPDAPVPLALLEAFGRPVTATSANRSGQPVARSLDEAIAQLGDGLDGGIDAGALASTIASTVLDLTTERPAVLRHGRIRSEDLEAFFGVPFGNA